MIKTVKFGLLKWSKIAQNLIIEQCMILFCLLKMSIL